MVVSKAPEDSPKGIVPGEAPKPSNFAAKVDAEGWISVSKVVGEQQIVEDAPRLLLRSTPSTF